MSIRAVLVLAATLLAGAASASTVTTREFDSPSLQRKWSYVAYLPTGYHESGLNYPVLYLLHGNGQKAYDWVAQGRIQQTADRLIATGEMPPAIIVMPEAGTSWYVDRKEKMETAVIEDLLPQIQASFRTIERRQGRFVAGLSMGGYGALRFAMKYPETFGAAALLSPAIYPEGPPANSSARRVGVFGAPDYDAQVWKSLNYPALLEGYLARQMPVPMYINSGDDDQFFIEEAAAQLYSTLRRNKQPAELRIVDGGHAWPVWADMIGDALRFLFGHSGQSVPAPAP